MITVAKPLPGLVQQRGPGKTNFMNYVQLEPWQGGGVAGGGQARTGHGNWFQSVIPVKLNGNGSVILSKTKIEGEDNSLNFYKFGKQQARRRDGQKPGSSGLSGPPGMNLVPEGLVPTVPPEEETVLRPPEEPMLPPNNPPDPYANNPPNPYANNPAYDPYMQVPPTPPMETIPMIDQQVNSEIEMLKLFAEKENKLISQYEEEVQKLNERKNQLEQEAVKYKEYLDSSASERLRKLLEEGEKYKNYIDRSAFEKINQEKKILEEQAKITKLQMEEEMRIQSEILANAKSEAEMFIQSDFINKQNEIQKLQNEFETAKIIAQKQLEQERDLSRELSRREQDELLNQYIYILSTTKQEVVPQEVVPPVVELTKDEKERQTIINNTNPPRRQQQDDLPQNPIVGSPRRQQLVSWDDLPPIIQNTDLPPVYTTPEEFPRQPNFEFSSAMTADNPFNNDLPTYTPSLEFRNKQFIKSVSEFERFTNVRRRIASLLKERRVDESEEYARGNQRKRLNRELLESTRPDLPPGYNEKPKDDDDEFFDAPQKFFAKRRRR
jgi:hypothetical protein